jgi:hypothetical protein
MTSNFQRDGVKYSLLVTSRSLREVQQAADAIQPDKSLWTTSQKRKHGLAPRKPWNNQYASGRVVGKVMGYLDDEAELRKRHCRNGRERSSHYYKPKAVEFTDRAEFR